MSRGFWDYKNEGLKTDIFGWDYNNSSEIADSDTPVVDVFKDIMISEIIYDMFSVLYAADSYFCGDWSEDSYREVTNEFKKKWINASPEELTKYFINKKIEEAKKELCKSFGVDDE